MKNFSIGKSLHKQRQKIGKNRYNSDKKGKKNPSNDFRAGFLRVAFVGAVLGAIVVFTNVNYGGYDTTERSVATTPIYTNDWTTSQTRMYVPGDGIDEFTLKQAGVAVTSEEAVGIADSSEIEPTDGSSPANTTTRSDSTSSGVGEEIADARESSQTKVAKLLKDSQLLSVTALRAAATSGTFNTAWIDDNHRAVMLEDNESNLEEVNLTRPVLAFYPEGYGAEMMSILSAAGLEIIVGPTFDIGQKSEGSNWPILLVIAIGAAIVFSVFRRTRDGSKMKDVSETGSVPTTRFNDIAGVDEALEDMSELVEFLRDPAKFEKVGALTPRGALLYGPPGTGKTLMARAVAGEAGVPFFAVAGSDFVEKFVGVGARRVRDIFEKAKKSDRAILFIDEIDAVAGRRSNEGGSGARETENTLVALLNEMDGFNGSRVIVIAATNRPDILDPAITRPGRLDRKIAVPAPDRRGREKIFQVHAKSRPVAESVDFVSLARRTPGMSGAEIAQVVNEAAIEAARSGKDMLDRDCFEAALATVTMGRARTSAFVTDADRRLTAWHEAGHTVCAYIQEHADKPVSVSIVPRGVAGGVTWMTGSDDQFLTLQQAQARLVTALGGRAGEEVHLKGSFTQGSHGDLENATNLALAMATQYGMTRLGLMIRRDVASTQVGEVVDELLADALDTSRTVISDNRAFMELLVDELLDKETLNAQEIEVIANRAAKMDRRSRVPASPTPASISSPTEGTGQAPSIKQSRHAEEPGRRITARRSGGLVREVCRTVMRTVRDHRGRTASSN